MSLQRTDEDANRNDGGSVGDCELHYALQSWTTVEALVVRSEKSTSTGREVYR